MSEPSTSLNALLKKVFADDPMRVVVCTDDKIDDVIRDYEARGLRCACISNTGLTAGYWRLTFLPPEAFKAPTP